jgi:hypothetical protein
MLTESRNKARSGNMTIQVFQKLAILKQVINTFVINVVVMIEIKLTEFDKSQGKSLNPIDVASVVFINGLSIVKVEFF